MAADIRLGDLQQGGSIQHLTLRSAHDHELFVDLSDIKNRQRSALAEVRAAQHARQPVGFGCQFGVVVAIEALRQELVQQHGEQDEAHRKDRKMPGHEPYPEALNWHDRCPLREVRIPPRAPRE